MSCSLRIIVSEIAWPEVKGKLTSAFRTCSPLTFRRRRPNRGHFSDGSAFEDAEACLKCIGRVMYRIRIYYMRRSNSALDLMPFQKGLPIRASSCILLSAQRIVFHVQMDHGTINCSIPAWSCRCKLFWKKGNDPSQWIGTCAHSVPSDLPSPMLLIVTIFMDSAISSIGQNTTPCHLKSLPSYRNISSRIWFTR